MCGCNMQAQLVINKSTTGPGLASRDSAYSLTGPDDKADDKDAGRASCQHAE